MVKINNASQITFAYADDNLTLIEEANRVAENVDPAAIQIDYEPQSGDYTDNSEVYWFTHSDGNKYLLIEPKGSLQVSIIVNFDGAATTNKYMDSIVDAKAQIQATQVIEGAIASEFGIDSSELIALPVTRSINLGQARLQELLARQ
ncbi:TPA: hypothetical protein ACSPFO_002498 [Enterococcus faecium]